MQLKEVIQSDLEEREKTAKWYNSENDLYVKSDIYDYRSQVYVRAYMIQYILTSMMSVAFTCQCGNLQVNYKCNFLLSTVFLFIYCIVIILHISLLEDCEEQSKKNPAFIRFDTDNF